MRENLGGGAMPLFLSHYLVRAEFLAPRRPRGMDTGVEEGHVGRDLQVVSEHAQEDV